MICITTAVITAPIYLIITSFLDQLLVDIETPSIETLQLLHQADICEHENVNINASNASKTDKTDKKNKIGALPVPLKSITGDKKFHLFSSLEQRRYIVNELQSVNEFLFKEDYEEVDTTDNDNDDDDELDETKVNRFLPKSNSKSKCNDNDNFINTYPYYAC